LFVFLRCVEIAKKVFKAKQYKFYKRWFC